MLMQDMQSGCPRNPGSDHECRFRSVLYDPGEYARHTVNDMSRIDSENRHLRGIPDSPTLLQV
jgi:hypothetical protein